MKCKSVINNNQAQASLAIIVIVMSIALLIIAGQSLTVVNSLKMSTNSVKSIQSYYTAEAGIEDSLLRIIDPSLAYAPTNSLSLNGGSAYIVINQAGNELTVNSQGDIDNLIRRLEVKLETTVDGASFNYGAQIGEGGLRMENNSKIIGNVYSNGDIIAVNSPEITGDAWAAGISTINGFNSIGIGVDAHANNITNSKIGRDAYYQTISNSTVLGTQYPYSPNSPQMPMPISEIQISDWKAGAADGGEMGDYVLSGSDTDSLGPIKINGNMTIQGTSLLTINGTIWVTGNIVFQNSAVLQLSADYGDMSAVLIADGTITVQNSFKICGSEGYNSSTAACNASNTTYLLLLSANTGNPAISLNNGSTMRAIVYAAQGVLEIQNNAVVVEATGYGLTIKNNAQLIYETGLINMSFSSGPGGGWEIINWKEI